MDKTTLKQLKPGTLFINFTFRHYEHQKPIQQIS